MKKYLHDFFKEEEGAELVQWCIIIAIAATLAVVALRISTKAQSKASEAENMIDEIDFGNTTNGASGE